MIAASRMSPIGAISTAILVITASSIWRGWILSLMWGWFIVPVSGLRAISIPEAIGLSLLAAMLCGSSRRSEEERSESLEDALGRSAVPMFVMPLVALGIASIVRLWL